MDSDCSVRRRDADGARAWGLRLTLAVAVPLALTLALTIPGAAAAQTLPPSRAASASDAAALPGAAQLGRRVALVIGNSKYSRVSDLGGKPINDAHDVSLALRGFGFEVLELLDGDKAQMEDKLTEFSQKIDGASAAFVFYAGHAAQLRGENYLMPVNVNVNTEAAIRADSISLSRVLDELEGAKDRINIVMLDACRNNPVTGKFRDARNGLAAPSVAPKGTVIVYATDPGNTAENGSGRNGVFTAGLLKAFGGKDLSLDAVLTVASEEVERTTERRQTPYVNGPKTVQKQFQFRVTVEPGPQELEGQIWATAQKQNTVAAYDLYKKRYPKGNFLDFADLALKGLRELGRISDASMESATPPVLDTSVPESTLGEVKLVKGETVRYEELTELTVYGVTNSAETRQRLEKAGYKFDSSGNVVAMPSGDHVIRIFPGHSLAKFFSAGTYLREVRLPAVYSRKAAN